MTNDFCKWGISFFDLPLYFKNYYMISKEEARKKLLIGYIFASFGLIIGSSYYEYDNKFLSFILIGYFVWSGYWGFSIVYNPISTFFSNIIVFEDNLYKLFIEFILKKLIVLSIILAISIIVGSFGGAVYMQITLSSIAYGKN